MHSNDSSLLTADRQRLVVLRVRENRRIINRRCILLARPLVLLKTSIAAKKVQKAIHEREVSQKKDTSTTSAAVEVCFLLLTVEIEDTK